MRRILIVAALCWLFILVNTVMSNTSPDYLPAYIAEAKMLWNRGDEGSTWQVFDFYTNANPAKPDYGDNPYGESMITINESDSYWDGNFDGWSGGYGPIDLSLQIPNNEDPLAYKEVWLELSYRGTLEEFSVIPEGLEGIEYTVEQLLGPDSNPGQGWALAIIGLRISPNPVSETINLRINSVPWCQVTPSVDYVIVDTLCIPEPATLLLLCSGIGLVNRLRRRRTL
jgi:hypothetical protein